MQKEPLVVSMYDAELFGHWWFEGPNFINHIFRTMQEANASFKPITPVQYLDKFPYTILLLYYVLLLVCRLIIFLLLSHSMYLAHLSDVVGEHIHLSCYLLYFLHDVLIKVLTEIRILIIFPVRVCSISLLFQFLEHL